MKKVAYEVSYYLSVKDTVGRNVSFCEILDWIKSNQFKEKVRKIRKLLKEAEEIGVKITEKPSNITDEEREKLSKDKEEKEKMAGEVKKSLPGFTASGVFINGRKAKNLKEYSGRIILDFDHTSDQTEMYKAKAKEIPFTECVFISPSGEGLKIIVHVNSGPEEHKKMFEAVRGFYEKELGFSVDPSGKDVSRLCFLAWDEDAYYNPDSKIFTWEDAPEVGNLVSITSKESPEKQEISAKEWKEIFSGEDLEKRIDCILTYDEKKYDFTPGNRNSSLFKLACFVNELGIPEREFINEAGKRFSASDFPLSEIEATIEHVYKDKAAKFGEKNGASSVISDKNDKNDIEEEDEESLLQHTPYIPDEVFPKLPELIKKMLPLARNNRERDILAWGVITMLSGCMPTVYCWYGNKKNYTPIFLFVTAGPAQGKGVLNNAPKLIGKFNKLIRIESDREMKEYKKELEKWEVEATQERKNGKPADLSKKPVEVHPKVLLFPQRFSRASMVQQLAYNGPLGMVVFAPEADALITANKAEYGGFMDCIRQSFHHEEISSSFKVDGEYPREIEDPKWALLISGTKNQFFKFFTTTEDGTLSRFAQYGYSTPPEWIDQFGENEEDIVGPLADEFCRLADVLRKKPLKIIFPKALRDRLNQTFAKLSKESTWVENEDYISAIRRHALILLRLAMVLTALRHGESPSVLDYRECTQEDFEIAEAFAITSLKHSLLLSTGFDNQGCKNTLKSPTRILAVFNEMPSIFESKVMIKECEAYNIKKRQVQRFLSEQLGKLVMREKKGIYSKIR